MTAAAKPPGKKTHSQARLPDGVSRVGSERPLFFVIVFNNLVRHRKLMMLSQLLAISENEAIGLLVRLWCECGERAQDGDLSRYSPAQIAAACGRPLKQARRLVDALVEAGFLDRDKRTLHVHDWPDYTGRAILNRQANRERVARFRKRHKAQARNGAVTITAPLRNGHVRPKTRLDKTREDIEKKRLELEETREEQTLLAREVSPSPPPPAHPGPSSPSPIFHTLSSPSPNPQPEKVPGLEPISQIVHRVANSETEQSQSNSQDHHQADTGVLPLPTLYHACTGLQPDRGALAYLTKLADKYGTQTVRETLENEGEQIAAADRPLAFLGGILENQRREGGGFRETMAERAAQVGAEFRRVGMAPPLPTPSPSTALATKPPVECAGGCHTMVRDAPAELLDSEVYCNTCSEKRNVR
jgi:hypothetical protein